MMLTVGPLLAFISLSTILSRAKHLETPDSKALHLTDLLVNLTESPQHSEVDFLYSFRKGLCICGILFGIYIGWATTEVFMADYGQMTTILFGVLMLSFPLRILMPFLGVTMFQLTTFAQIAALTRFREMHNVGEIKVEIMARTLRSIIMSQRQLF